MEAMYKIKANELDSGFIQSIRELFKDKEVTITISTETDTTSYLLNNLANDQHLKDNIAAEPTARFIGNEFSQFVKDKTDS